MSTYDDWKLATPPEYEREEEDAPPAGPSAPSASVHRCKDCAAGRHAACADPDCSCMDTITCGSPPKPEEDISW